MAASVPRFGQGVLGLVDELVACRVRANCSPSRTARACPGTLSPIPPTLLRPPEPPEASDCGTAALGRVLPFSCGCSGTEEETERKDEDTADLSQVFFIATANVIHTVPPALQDRMEVLRLHGYTEPEKVEIAKQFLVKKQMLQAGLTEKNVQFSDDAIRQIIRGFTREAGVRNLEREIGNICRKIARKVVKEGADFSAAIQPEKVGDWLGVLKFRDTLAHEKSEIGLVTGLAWTEVGGSILSTEAAVVDGKGKLTLTGQLGDVMQESAQAAMSYIRSRAARLGLARDFYRNQDIHVHVPEGAIPKDGPSAGITIATALASALSRIPVRRDIAMTGEITLRGKVLPIGGLKEKLLAAHRAGLFEVILPKENEKDVAEVPENLRSAMKLHFVDNMDQVLAVALEGPLPQMPSEAETMAPIATPPAGDIPAARQ